MGFKNKLYWIIQENPENVFNSFFFIISKLICPIFELRPHFGSKAGGMGKHGFIKNPMEKKKKKIEYNTIPFHQNFKVEIFKIFFSFRQTKFGFVNNVLKDLGIMLKKHLLKLTFVFDVKDRFYEVLNLKTTPFPVFFLSSWKFKVRGKINSRTFANISRPGK